MPTRDAGRANARGRSPGAKPGDLGDHRVDESVRRPVRYRLGNHECVHGFRQHADGHIGRCRRSYSRTPLIATAMGLFAAIPAVIAYNRYADKVVRLEIRYDGFTEEFSSILQRHARNAKKAV